MSFSAQIKAVVEKNHLLKHPFYQAWNDGQLDRATLQTYAKEYYVHVKAFPRYISATHSQCEDLENRRILLENLNEEEGFVGVDHPELWLRFADALGVEREEAERTPGDDAIHNVINTFMGFGRSSYAEGLASLYSYESQVPEVAQTKIDGLSKYYEVADQRGLSFFTVHREADVHHRKACEELLDQIPEEDQPKALAAAEKSSQALWDFLSSFPLPHNCH